MISVVLTVYNVEKYISECIKSLLSQTCSDFEIILVNDGTPDNSVAIAESLLKNGSIPYRIINTENRGVSSARNTGIKNSLGEYFITVDADDTVSPTFVEDLKFLASKWSSNDVFICNYRVVSAEGCTKFERNTNIEQVLSPDMAQRLYDKRIIKFLLPAMMIRHRYVLEHNIFFDNEVRYSEDVQYIWKILAYSKHDIIYTQNKNYNYVLHEGSTMTASGVKKILTGFTGIHKLNDEIGSMLISEVGNGFVGKWIFAMLHGAAKMLEKKDYFDLYSQSNANNYFKEAAKYGGIKTKLIVVAFKISPTMGYKLMRKF